MTKIEFRLTMPNTGSWNKKWSGETKNYTRLRELDPKAAATLLENGRERSWTYAFGDGWVACITARIIHPEMVLAPSDGFHGYEWMIESLLKRGVITLS